MPTMLCLEALTVFAILILFLLIPGAVAFGTAVHRLYSPRLLMATGEKAFQLLGSQPVQKFNRSAQASVLNVQGNTFLKVGDVDKAVECYNTALSVCDDDQQCALLVMRGTAMLQRAYDCKMRFNDVVRFTIRLLPSAEAVTWYCEAISTWPIQTRCVALAHQLGRARGAYLQLDQAATWGAVKGSWPDAKEGEVLSTGQELLQRSVYVWALYETALINALDDCLAATLLRPDFAQAWRRTAGALVELGLHKKAIEYYEVAIRLDTSLGELLRPTIARLRFQHGEIS